MKQNILYKVFATVVLMLTFPICFTSCIEDDGTYDYKELPEIAMENIPALTEVLQYIDHIQISPKFVSSTEGEIKPGDANYEVLYRLGHKGMGNFGYDYEQQKSIVWKELDFVSGTFNLDVPADFPTGMYTLWITLTDKRDGSVTSKQFDISIVSTTYEGWLVLCNEGSDNVARLDMITKLPGNRINAIHNICEGLPTLHNATCINAWAEQMNPGDQIHMFTQEGAYILDPETMEGDPDQLLSKLYFTIPPIDNLIKERNFSGTRYGYMNKYKICFGDQGNAYVKLDGTSGAAYASAVNTLVEGYSPTFRVAPYCGFNWTRPWVGSYGEYLLFYDIDNKRFLLYDGKLEKLQMNVIPEPGADDVRLFSYTTGLDFVYMQSTRRSNGLVYTILQNPSTGKRSIYGINLGGSSYAQELYIPDVSAPDFEKATTFAFDNRFPLLFYSVGNKIYCYNLGTKQATQVPSQFTGDDEITLMYFNLYNCSDYSILSNQSDEFFEAQYRLIVGTSSNSDAVSGGKVTFFDVDGVNNTAKQAEQYTGFGKIVDMIYRERNE